MSRGYIDLPVEGGGGVTSVNGITGAADIVAGSGITVTPSGQNITIAATAVGLNYFNGYLQLNGGGSVWQNTGSATFADLTPDSGASFLTTRGSNGITVIANPSNLPGITFTPSSATAVYVIYCQFACQSASPADQFGFRIWDGTNEIATSSVNTNSYYHFPGSVLGVYAPGTTSTVNVTLQYTAQGNDNMQ